MKLQELIQQLELAVKLITDIQNGKQELTQDVRAKLLQIYNYSFNERVKFYNHYQNLLSNRSPEREKEEAQIIEQALGGEIGQLGEFNEAFNKEIEKINTISKELKEAGIEPQLADNNIETFKEQKQKDKLQKQLKDFINQSKQPQIESDEWELPDYIVNYNQQVQQEPKNEIKHKPKVGIFKRIFTAIKTTVKTGATKIKNLFKKRK